MTSIRTALLAATVLVAFAGQAAALSFKDIAGLGCGLNTNYNFAPHQLTVTFHDRSPARRFKVNSYDYLPGTIKMHWENNDKKLFTDFSEFSPDGLTMAQQANENGPRRPFKRCK